MNIHGNTSVISHNIDVTFINLTGRKVPIAWQTDIRFIRFLFVQIKDTVPKSDNISFQGDDTFQQDDPLAC